MVKQLAWGLAIAAIAVGSDARAQAPTQPPPPQPQPAPPPQQQQQPQPQPHQPQPQPQPHQPQPPPLPPAQASTFYRFTLNDGRVIDVQIVGGDAVNYHVQTGGAVYSVPRTSVISSVALAQPIVFAAPPAPQTAQPVAEDNDLLARNPRAAGWVYFGLGYLAIAPIALARRDNDGQAAAGLIPVVGPLLWTIPNDDDDAFEDGWDWLAGVDTLIQAAGLYLVISGGSRKKSNQTVLMPMSQRGAHGFAVGGSF